MCANEENSKKSGLNLLSVKDWSKRYSEKLLKMSWLSIK